MSSHILNNKWILLLSSLVGLATTTETVFAPFPKDFAWGVATAAY